MEKRKNIQEPEELKLYQGMNGVWFVKKREVLRGGFHDKTDAEKFYNLLLEVNKMEEIKNNQP
ncbi:hypothetical protein ETU09_05870 [Apibacter muscae]|uniref:Uncharacterized protein n=1 Tax=Apibacter muscae TaxID=2509004 RepID=A0A563DE27_9FLAO|nr:hypothetical protein [Apibacter muscae]TWP28450.1 hypothetical protein ETU09_05870 [Apibacter muscae]